MREWIRNYSLRHLQAALNGLGQLSRNGLATLMTILVIGVTLALPAGLYLALQNISYLKQPLEDTRQITLYFNEKANEQTVSDLKKALLKQKSIKTIQLVSPEEGLKEWQAQQKMPELLKELPENPLPWVMIITPKPQNNHELETLASELSALPLVQHTALDLLWAKRLSHLFSIANHIAFLLMLFLSLTVLLIINHSIRTFIEHNQLEIQITQLIGGTDAFIRRPFLYAGLFYGFLGGIIALQVIDIFLWKLNTPVQQLAELYNSSFKLAGLSITHTFLLLGSSMLLGLLGAYIAVERTLCSFFPK